MNRLLSPNEAKFWLLDRAAPMNSVVVLQRAGGFALDPDGAFALPGIELGRQLRPRWTTPGAPGSLRREEAESDTDWLSEAEELLDERVGTEGQPGWRATVQDHPGGSTLVLAVNHALTDWRRSLLVARSFVRGSTSPGELAPPCEELLPASAFSAPDAGELIEEWWTSRAGTLWETAGLERLTAVLPPPARTRLRLARLPQAETDRLQRRCEAEGVSLNSALAIAVRDVMELSAVAHSVDMERFIRPAPRPGPGLAVSHVFTALPPGEFWEAARENRSLLFEQIKAGAAGDALLVLPRLLLRPGTTPSYERAAMTITGGPTVRSRHDPSGDDEDEVMQVVLSSARGGGGILILSFHGRCLQLVAGSPEDQPEVPLPAIVDRLLSASQ